MHNLRISLEKKLKLMEQEVENKDSIIENLKRLGTNQNETVIILKT